VDSVVKALGIAAWSLEVVKKEIAKLPPGPDADPEDYADEPVAQ
jgi:hypothetical protein